MQLEFSPRAVVDYVHNGVGYGPIGEALGDVGYDPGFYRPYYNEQGKKAVTVNTGRQIKKKYRLQNGQVMTRTVNERKEFLIKDIRDVFDFDIPVYNATTLSKDQWILFDTTVTQAARKRLRAWSIFAETNTISFNGMAKSTYEYEAEDDTGEALQDMDTLTDDRQHTPMRVLSSVPLPITHSGFFMSARRIASSRAPGGQDISTNMVEKCGRRIGELIEKQTIGVELGMVYGPTSSTDARYRGTSAIYGMTIHPNRVTKTDLTTPTGSNPEAVKQDVIEMREQMYNLGFYGPFALLYTPGYDAFLDDDYFRSGSTAIQRTLRERIESIDGIVTAQRLDFWTGSTYQMVLVQLEPENIAALVGMPLTLIQWESQGGWKRNFKAACIQAPLIKYDQAGNARLLHATTS